MTSITAELFGSKIGGYIGGLPSTAVVSFFFIGLTQSPQTAAQATEVFPLAYSITGLFLVCYAVFSRRGIVFALSGSISIWLLFSALIILFDLDNFLISLIAYVLIFIISYYLLEKRLKIPFTGRIKTKYKALQILARAMSGGTIVAFAVLMSKVGGPIFGGIFSAFPAVFISILIITYKSRGMNFSISMTKPLMKSGMLTVVAYGISVRYLYPSLGLILGTFGAYLISLMIALFLYILSIKMFPVTKKMPHTGEL